MRVKTAWKEHWEAKLPDNMAEAFRKQKDLWYAIKGD